MAVALGNYKMTLNQEKKVFNIYAEGIMTPELGAAYTNEFIEKSKSIDSKEWSLVIDVKNLNTNSHDVAEMLVVVMKLYFSVPYKKRYMTKIQNAVCFMQVKKLGAAIPDFNSMIWVDNVDNI